MRKVVEKFYVEANQLTEEQLKRLRNMSLAEGEHDAPSARPKLGYDEYGYQIKMGVCMMEAANYIMGRAHSDAPACVLQKLQHVGMDLNDDAPSQRARNQLKDLIPRIVGTQRIQIIQYSDGSQTAHPAPTADERARDRRMTKAWTDLHNEYYIKHNYEEPSWYKRLSLYKQLIDLP